MNTPKTVVSPELVGMDKAVVVNAANTNATAVEAPAVPGEQFPHVLGELRVILEYLQIGIYPVYVVVHGQDVYVKPPVKEILGAPHPSGPL